MLFFDIETNGIEDWNNLTDLNKLFVISAFDTDHNRMVSCSEPERIKKLLDYMSKCDLIVGHNIIGFDLPALKKLYGFTHPNVLDTVVLSRCIYPDIRESDFKEQGFPKDLIGRHSLKAWGYRLGILKDSHGETETWTELTPEMISYCEQDVNVTKALYNHLLHNKPSEQMVNLEHSFAKLMRQQEANGFPFDEDKAEKLCSVLTSERVKLKTELQEMFGPSKVEMKSHWFVDKAGNKYPTKKAALEVGVKAADLSKGDKKTKEIPFNPNSRDQIAERLLADGWKPDAYEGKRPAINEAVLKTIGTPTALKLCDYLLVSKRLGQISEGQQAWLKLVKNGRLHGRVNTNGAVSGRCTHNNPNVAQVPASRAPYGKECRELFTAPKGKVLVGADASGLELRCLGHYLHSWDKGQYCQEILNGDIHTANQKAAGLETRDQAKTFIYAFLYGAGDAKIGAIVGGNSADGKRLKASFFQKIPAVKKLVMAVQRNVEITKHLKGLDGRILPCRSSHSALNLLLQSAGAVIMKQSLIEFSKRAKKPYELHGNIHDEVQFSCDKEHADELGQAFCDSIEQAGKVLRFRCPLAGEYSVGKNWAETH